MLGHGRLPDEELVDFSSETVKFRIKVRIRLANILADTDAFPESTTS